MAGNSSLQEKLRQGIDAARRGDKLAAQRLLRQVVESDHSNEVAWMWLASTLDNLQERRAALEEALKINPNNTRAAEALRQLDAVLPPTTRRAAQARGGNAALPRPAAGATNNTLLLVGGAIIGLIILVVIIFAVVNSTQNNNNNVGIATQQALQSALLNTAVPTPTINPTLYTATPFYGVIVTAENNNANLPPTFTPTFTPAPTSTPLPTETPFPLAKFSILYTSLNNGDTQPSLFKMAGDGSGDQQIGAGSDGYSDIAYSPDGKLIAFVRNTTAEGATAAVPELFVGPADNPGGAQQITQFTTSHLASPSWGPDSISLLFVSNKDGDDEIWYITEDGNNLRQLTQSDGVDKDPVFSPDGNTILFASERANYVPDGTNLGLTEIFSMATDGTNVTQLTDDQGSSYTPSFSPDGLHVVFGSDRSGKSNIYIMGPDGQGVSRLTLDPDAEYRQPAYTPNGKNIVFLSNLGGTDFQFYVMDTSGNNVKRLSDPGRNIQSFAILHLPLALFNP